MLPYDHVTLKDTSVHILLLIV